MKNTVFFAICKYVPSLLRGEKLNIGFAYHIPNNGEIGFFSSKNTRRIISFDDEIDAEIINYLFESLKYDFSSETFENYDNYDDKKLKNPDLLHSKIANYVNQIQFDDVSVYESNDSIQSILNDISDMHLYYDKSKAERITSDRVISLARKMVKSSIYKDTLEKSEHKDVFYAPPFDFKIIMDGQTKYIKGFSFDYKQTSRFFKEIKSYLFDLNNEISKGRINLKDIKIVINNTEFDNDHEKIIKEYLPDGLDLITLEKFGNIIAKDHNYYYVN